MEQETPMPNKSIVMCFVLALFVGCNSRSERRPFIIDQNPAWVDRDSFLSDGNYLQHNESEYYILKIDRIDKHIVLASIDSFVKKHAPLQCRKYDNYSILFYKESPELNMNVLSKYSEKYKIFNDEENYLLASYSYSDSTLLIRTVK
jgi:hypothetical protein